MCLFENKTFCPFRAIFLLRRNPKKSTEVSEEIFTSVFRVSCACCPLHAGFLLGLLFEAEYGADMFFPKRRLTLSGLQGDISQK
jgi:hypothetical protein